MSRIITFTGWGTVESYRASEVIGLKDEKDDFFLFLQTMTITYRHQFRFETGTTKHSHDREKFFAIIKAFVFGPDDGAELVIDRSITFQELVDKLSADTFNID